MSAQPSPLRRHVTVLAIYSLLSLLLTLPLALRLTTAVPGDGIDDPALAWNLWWLKHSLIDRQINPFDSQWMFYPVGINLAFYTLTIWNGLLSIPLQTAFSVVVASNLLLLSSFVLGGYGAYLLCLHVLRTVGHAHDASRGQRMLLDGAAFLGGLLFAFSSSKLFYAALGQFNIASSHWIPFAVFYTLRSVRPNARLREALLAALFVLLQAYAELTYAAFLGIFTAMVALWALAQLVWPASQSAARQRGREALRLLRNLAVLAIVFVIGLMPILANMLPDMRAEGDFLVEGEGFADVFSADLAGYALPTQLHPLLGDIVVTASADSALQADGVQWQVNKGQHLTLGFLGLGLAIAGAWTHRRRRETWFWVITALVFFLLTLGPSLRWMGHDTGIPGPFRILQDLPFLKGNRYPSRFSVMLLVSVAPLVAMGSHWLLSRLATRQRDGRVPRRRVALTGTIALAAIVLFENLSAPLPLADMQTPAIYETIAAEAGDFAVLDLPAGWRNGFSVFGKQDLIIMSEQWWQTSHGKPILGGNTSRNPEFKFRYFLDAPLIGPLTVLANADDAHLHIQEQMASALAALRAGDPALGGHPLLAEAAVDAANVLQTLNVRFVVVHRDQGPPEFTQFVERFMPVTLVAQDGEHALYRVDNAPPASDLLITPATDALARGEGWSGIASNQEAEAAWAHRRETRLLTAPLAPGSYVATIRAAAAGEGQTLKLVVNGTETDTQTLPAAWSELSFRLPPKSINQGANEIVLQFGETFPTAGLAGGVLPEVNLLVESAGLEAGNYAHIWLNGSDISPNQRGYNIAIIDGATGEVVAVDSFDTHREPAASDELVRFVQQAVPGQVVALAIKDTASDQLSSEAAQVLVDLGLTDMRGRFRWSQAAIVDVGGDKAVEDIDGLQSASAGIGAGWREPAVAAQVEWLKLERAGD